MTKQFSTLQLFSIVDGRMSTTMDDIYNILNHVTNDNLMTRHLPTASRYLQKKSPEWYINQKANLASFRASFIYENKKEPEFQDYINKLAKQEEIVNVPQLKDEFDTSDFGSYMVDNSLLLNRK